MESKDDVTKESTSKWSTREHFLLVVAIVFAVLTFVLLPLLLIELCKKPKYEVCLTKNCAVTASHLISAMDTTVDPCKNFYHFTCNGFIKEDPIPEESSSTFLSYQKKLDTKLRDVLESTNPTGKPEVIFKMQEAYHVCLNFSFSLDKELDSFKKFVKHELNWPFVSYHQSQTFFVEDYLGNMRRNGIISWNDPIQINIHSNPHDRSQNILLISGFAGLDFPLLPSANEENNGNEAIHDIHEFYSLNKVAALFDVTDSEVLNTIGKDITTVSKEIRKVLMDIETIIEVNYEQQMKMMTFEELNVLTDQNINWLQFANTVFKDEHTFRSTDVIAVARPKYLKDISKVIKKFPNRALGNYFGWQAIDTLSRLSTARETIFGIEQGIHGQRWKRCLMWIQNTFPLALTRLFVNAHVDKSGKQVVDNMVQLVQNAYRSKIENSDWLDKESKTEALKKAENMKRMIGYPDEIFDNSWIENKYNYIVQVNPVHFDNFIQFKRNSTRNNMKYVNQNYDFNTWSENADPLIINAFFTPNVIWLPTGIMQLPFFDINRIQTANFGMLGSIIGHEIGHGFDQEGSKYDHAGNLKQCWTNATFGNYKKKTKCYIDQYNKYCPEFMRGGENDKVVCLNGTSTLADNIADNVGVKTAYAAYKMWADANRGQLKRLPGLEEFTPDQLFFISFGYNWCDNLPIDEWEDLYITSPTHAPGEYRVMGSLANLPEFATAFNCPVGPMNRGEDRCVLW